LAKELGLPIFQPDKLKLETEKLLEYNPEALVVAAYGQILPRSLLDAMKFGGINVHASLLPRWRGAAPVAFSILKGDEETGVSIMKMEAGLDTGPVYLQKSIPLHKNVTTPLLTEALSELGADSLIAVMQDIEDGKAVATPQDDALATVAPRIKKETARIEWFELSAVEVDRHLRAMQPWPGTKALIAGIEVEICSGQALGTVTDAAPGQVVAQNRDNIVVSTRSGDFRIDEVRPPSKAKMEASAFLRGRGN
jgi:methionyl-tRNA formyltransferase